MTVAMAVSLVSGSLAFAQGTSGTMPDKAMSPPGTMGGATDKASMPMDKGSMDKPGMPMDKGGMGKTGMPMDKGSMDKPGMPMDKAGMGKTGMPMDKGGMDKPGMGMDKAGMAGSKAKTATGPVDINAADASSLQTVKGIGPAKAKAIVAYRQQNGPFKNLDELEKVPGIGKKTLASLKDKLIVGKGL